MDSDDEINATETFNIFCDDYLKENIGEPLCKALTYVLLYRPDDPIEFIVNFLIDWSRKKPHVHTIEEQKEKIKDLLNERYERKQEINFENVKHLQSTNEKQNYFDNEKNQVQEQNHQISARQHVHLHDTACGFDVNNDKINNNQETNKNLSVCHDGNLSSFAYFSKLRDKIIKCDEFSNKETKDESKN